MLVFFTRYFSENISIWLKNSTMASFFDRKYNTPHDVLWERFFFRFVCLYIRLNFDFNMINFSVRYCGIECIKNTFYLVLHRCFSSFRTQQRERGREIHPVDPIFQNKNSLLANVVDIWLLIEKLFRRKREKERNQNCPSHDRHVRWAWVNLKVNPGN